MANIFGRAVNKLRSLFGKPKEEVESIRLAAIRDRRRAEDQLASLAKLTAEARAKAAGAARLRNERELALQKQRLEALSRQERIAKEAEVAARRQEGAAKEALMEMEARKSEMRRQLLLSRKKIAESGEWEKAFPGRGPAPKSPEVYEDVKTGVGGLPDLRMFMLGYKYEAFSSSNVQAVQYDPVAGDLYIQYVKKQRWYKYLGVSRDVAAEFYMGISKGIVVWDLIRVRGDNPRDTSPPARTRIPFERDRQPPSYLPLDSSAGQFAAAGGF